MKRVFMTFVLALPATAPVAAGPLAMPSPLIEEQQAKSSPLNFRLVADRPSDPSPIHKSGMIAHKAIGPNATFGVGLFKMAPKKLGSGETRIDGRAPTSRRAAVSFVLKF